MDWISFLGVIGISNIITGIVSWTLGGKRTSNANASIVEIEALKSMKDYYRDEIAFVKKNSEEVKKYADEMAQDLKEVKEWTCNKEDCPDRIKIP